MIKQAPRMYRLSFYEESVGILYELSCNNTFLAARMSEEVLALPQQMEPKLLPLIGTYIGILRTDIPQKEYLVRRISEKKTRITDEFISINSILCNLSEEATAEKAKT